MRVSVPLVKFYEKLLPTQNFSEIGELAAELWQNKQFSIHQPHPLS